MQYKSNLLGLVLVVLAAGACQTYSPKPLDPLKILEQAENDRRLLDWENPEGDGAFTFLRAALLMSSHSPALKEVAADFAVAQALAEVETPIPNPSVEGGVLIGSNIDGDTSRRVQPAVSLGFTLPLSPRLSRQDDLNQAAANLAYLELLVTHRLLYLDLRTAYSRWVLTGTRARAWEAISLSLEKTRDLMDRLAKAGVVGALDVGQVELELQSSRIESLDAAKNHEAAALVLSELIGVHPDRFGTVPLNPLPELPETLPGRSGLKSVLIRHNLDLALLRGAYEKAERRLALEITRQYPDLQLGTSLEKGPTETMRELGLSIGFEIPLFDRNQQGIAEARQNREAVREKYEAQALRILARLDHALCDLEKNRGKQRIVEDQVLPQAEKNLELARKLIRAGHIDALQYLEVERALNRTLIDRIGCELALREALIAMEALVGYPLWLFPSEREGTIPPLTDFLDNLHKTEPGS